jgi:deazaflavin-dependent oxidoreductase (nitroreductase family)
MNLTAARDALESGWNCRLTTQGRKTGFPREVTIWFALDGDEVVLAGSAEGPQWLRNLAANPGVELNIAGHRLRGQARVVEDESGAEAVRQCFVQRYLAARLSRPFGGYTTSTAVRVAIESVAKL